MMNSRCASLKRIYDERKRAKQFSNQKEFADNIGITESHLSKILRGSISLSCEKARKIEQALGLKEGDLDIDPHVVIYLLSKSASQGKRINLKDEVIKLNEQWHLQHRHKVIRKADYILGDADVHFTANLLSTDYLPELIDQINTIGMTDTKSLLVIKAESNFVLDAT